MAEKDKVPIVAIRQIVQMRHDEYRKHSYKAIAEHIKDEFGIEVTPQAVGYLYRKNKDKYAVKEDQEVKKTGIKEKPVFKPKKPIASLSDPVFEKYEEVNLKDLFDKAE